MVQYQAKNIIEIADYFRILANDQLASVRWQSSQKAEEKCKHEAYIWKQAAEILENVEIKIDGDMKMDEDNFTILNGKWEIVMSGGQLTINNCEYEEHEDDPTYDLVRMYWRLSTFLNKDD